ncbi:hypothetical protein ACWD4G_36890 [Streptomyces sp. NPDC002643]
MNSLRASLGVSMRRRCRSTSISSWSTTRASVSPYSRRCLVLRPSTSATTVRFLRYASRLACTVCQDTDQPSTACNSAALAW